MDDFLSLIPSHEVNVVALLVNSQSKNELVLLENEAIVHHQENEDESLLVQNQMQTFISIWMLQNVV